MPSRQDIGRGVRNNAGQMKKIAFHIVLLCSGLRRGSLRTDKFCTDLKAERARLKTAFQADIVHMVYTELPDYNPEVLPK